MSDNTDKLFSSMANDLAKVVAVVFFIGWLAGAAAGYFLTRALHLCT